MVAVGFEKDWGRLDFFILPDFQERDFPDWRGRLRALQPVDENGAVLESENGKAVTDIAERYSQDFGDWDFEFSVFHGLSREARLPLSADRSRRVPNYDLITRRVSTCNTHWKLGSGSSRASFAKAMAAALVRWSAALNTPSSRSRTPTSGY